jgi:hypothetical protein
MVLYNVTVSIDEDIHEEWLRWMIEVHIPEVLATGHFLENKISRIEGYEEGGLSYAIQYLVKSREDYDTYQRLHAPRLQQAHTERYAGKFAAFRTVLNVVHQSTYTAE